MPYSRDWDESFPPGTELANTLDTIIQHFKTDVRERIEQVIPGWTDEGEDPKRAVIQIGELANRPVSGDAHMGEFFFATDTLTLYIFNGAEWITLVVGDEDGDVAAPIYPKVKAIKQSSQTLPPQTNTLITWTGDAIQFEVAQDDKTWFDANQSTTDFVVPMSGRYLVIAGMGLLMQSSGVNTSTRELRIRRNGTIVAEDDRVGLDEFAIQQSFAAYLELSEGDVITLEATQRNTDNVNATIVGSPTTFSTKIEITRLP